MPVAKQRESKTYFGIRDGMWATKVAKDHPEAKRIVPTKGPNAGKEQFIYEVPSLEGRIISIHTEKSDYGRQFKILIEDPQDGDQVIATIDERKKLGAMLLNYLPYMEYGEIYCFDATKYKGTDGKERNYLFIKKKVGNNYATVDQKWPKFEGLPPIEEYERNGETEYDSTNRFNVMFAHSKSKIMEWNSMAGEPYIDMSDSNKTSSQPPAQPRQQTSPAEKPPPPTMDGPLPGDHDYMEDDNEDLPF